MNVILWRCRKQYYRLRKNNSSQRRFVDKSFVRLLLLGFFWSFKFYRHRSGRLFLGRRSNGCMSDQSCHARIKTAAVSGLSGMECENVNAKRIVKWIEKESFFDSQFLLSESGKRNRDSWFLILRNRHSTSLIPLRFSNIKKIYEGGAALSLR